MLGRTFFIMALLVCFGMRVSAQEDQVNVSLVISESHKLGLEPHNLKLRGELIRKLLWPTLASSVTYGSQPKSYLGDGRSLSTAHELRLPVKPWFYVAPGVEIATQFTSAYRKTALYPTLAAGWNYRHRLVPQVTYYLTDPLTENRLRGWKFGGRYYGRLAPKWRIVIGADAGRYSYFQPNPPTQGQIRAWSFDLALGFARTLGRRN